MQVVRHFALRKEVGYETLELNNKQEMITTMISMIDESTGLVLVYCRYTGSAMSLLSAIRSRRRDTISCALYHGQLSLLEKENVMTQIQQGSLKVLVSTLAFGLGVDLNQVTKVIAVGKFDSLLDIVQ
ncbi:MAG TPA: hypothetical protein DCE78_02675, partial [Bacteroidetes bacterium]|nr:hypothetical protein [Bacteroidota bacterium]